MEANHISIISAHTHFLILFNSFTWTLHFCYVSAAHFLYSIPAAASSV